MSPRRPARRGAVIAGVAGVAAVATVVTLAVTASGYEAQEVPRLETSVWVTRDTGQYARVNTDLAEIDLVRDVDDPSTIVQVGAAASARNGWVKPALIGAGSALAVLAAAAAALIASGTV